MKWTLLPLALLLAACEPAAPPTPETPASVLAAPARTLDRARAVEGQLRDAAAAQRERIDAATQP